MPTTRANFLYIGPIRPETLALLSQNEAEHALFITPSENEAHWQEVQEAIPHASQQVIKLAENSGELPYYEFNLPEFNASRPASGLYTLYPGLELIESAKQPLVGVEAQLGELEKETEIQEIGALVVEQPELVWPVLQVLASNQRYQHIKALWLRVGAVPLYHGMPETDEILTWCQEHGFELQARNEDDPDLPLLQLTRHAYYHRWQEEAKRSAKLAKQLKTAQQEAEQQLAQQATEQAERIKELEQREATSQKRLADSEEQLHQQHSKYEQLQQKYKNLEQQLAEQQKSANNDRAVKEKEAQQAELQKQLNQITEERDTLKKQLNQSLKSSQQHQKEHEEIKQQLEETQKKLGILEQQYQDAEHAGKKAQKKIEESTEEVASLQAELKKQQVQVENLQEGLAAREEERDKYKSYFANRKKKHEEAETKLAETQQMSDEKDTTIRQLSEQLDTLQHSNERFGQLESKLESLFSEQRTYIQQTTNVLGQHVTRSARQQRDEQAMINYLQYGQRPITTQLSPSYVTALLEHYDTHNPDVVVIFGAAETTELLAQRIIHTRAEVSRIGKSDHRQETLKEVTVSHDDLPQTIISIEHNKAACESLKESLNNKRLSPAVNVVNAPWVECQSVNAPVALFYAVDTTLQRLNQWLPENARILVIVGETLPQAGHSREAVLPLLLKQLFTQRLDIVLEGSNKLQETRLQENWNKLLENRQRPGQWLSTYNLCLLKI
ncbi:hypothetical protein J4377_11730 [Halomonas sp. XH26]|uniref:hypothetical protein n=1 Tax=Halomonas sp. XH26 TaxID=2557993 RepID=UPI0020A077A6|nr:hypothetical protein [Halomonas sp. XH26]UTA78636.1 hypothetical protein J4377_11730 [Halomonas sp. XH26]